MPDTGPTFIAIGAQKCGSTSLHAWLAGHPEVAMSTPKELHYFDRQDEDTAHLAYRAGFPSFRDPAAAGRRSKVGAYPDHDWYRAQFPLRSASGAKARARGEATPNYIFWPGAVSRIHAFAPGLRLVCCLRDPGARAMSQYQMECARGDEDLPEREAFAAEPQRLETGGTWAWRHHSYLARGRYAEQLTRLYALFPRAQVLVLRFEDLIGRTEATLRRLTDFLGLSPDPGRPLERRNRGPQTPADPATLRWLSEHFAPHNARLTAEFGIPTYDWAGGAR